MTKLVLYVVVSVVVLAGAIGGYRYFTRTEVVQVPVPTTPQPQQEAAQQKVVPPHKKFDDRFQPKF